MLRSLGLFAGALFAVACGDAAPPGEDGGAWRDGAPRLDGAPLADGAPSTADGTVPGADGGPPGGGPLWDVTEASGIDFTRVPRDDYGTLPDRFSGGVCVLDADGRPPLDLFFALRPSASGSSRLYIARGPFDYVDETEARGLDDVGDAVGCLAFDPDGDGDQDLLVTGLGEIRLFTNASGAFSDATAALLPGLSLDPRDLYASAAAGDLDDDGDTDLVVAGMIRFDTTGLPERCGGLACAVQLLEHAPIPSLVLVRRSDGRYEERTASLAPDLALAEPTLVVAIHDIDGDARSDIYVGNDLGFAFRDRVLSRDASGVFRDRAAEVGLAYNQRGYGIDTMGYTTGDVDGNGLVDHVVTSWEDDATAVFLCNGTTCDDSATSVGTLATIETFRWGAALFDLELDGDLDLVEATGHIYSDAESLALSMRGGREQRPNLLLGTPSGTLVPFTLGVEPRASRGIAIADLDDDGRTDVVLAPAVGRPLLLRNVAEPRGAWVRVRLEGRAPATDAGGALVTVRWPGGARVRPKLVGEGYLGSFDPRLTFGVPSPGSVDVDVRWPDGTTSAMRGVAVGGEVVIRQ